jgi:hypothetical protein
MEPGSTQYLDEPYSENILGFCFNDEFGKTMNKIEFIGVLKDECSLPKQEAVKIVDLLFGEMTKALAKGERVKIRGWCSIYV